MRPMVARESLKMGQPINARADFGIVRYANCWEDADILCDALQPESGKRILSIASAGDNALSMAAAGAEVVAVDISLAQLACVELRIAAIRQLSYDDVLAFLGVQPCADRESVFDRLRSDLTDSTRHFWTERMSDIRDGFIHCGKFEKYFHTFRRRVLPWVHRRGKIDQLLAEKGEAERRLFYKSTWNNWRWRWMFRLFFSRTVMGRLGRDPEFFRYVEGSVAERILARTKHALTVLPTHDNPYLQYILRGNYEIALPNYLRPENFEAVRAGLPRLQLFHGSVEEAAKRFGPFDGFNLSDIFEYLDVETGRDVYAQLVGAANSGARLAYWNMLVPRRCPETLKPQLEPRDDLAKRLHELDRAFFYSAFVVEEVR